jgi:hypothetical protein
MMTGNNALDKCIKYHHSENIAKGEWYTGNKRNIEYEREVRSIHETLVEEIFFKAKGPGKFPEEQKVGPNARHDIAEEYSENERI